MILKDKSSRLFDTIDSKTDIDIIKQFCDDARSDGLEGSLAFETKGWHNNQASFLYKVIVDKTFDQDKGGVYIVCKDGDRIVAGQGSCRLHDTEYMIFGTRGYTMPKYRNRHNYDFLQYCTSKFWELYIKEYKGYIMAFNKYNYKIFLKYMRLNNVTPDYFDQYVWHRGRKVVPMRPHPDLININYTPQHVLYGGKHEAELLEYLNANKV